METPKREKETYPTEPRDHEADAQAAVKELEKKGHHVLDTGDCDDDCPVCTLYNTNPEQEYNWLIKAVVQKFKGSPKITQAEYVVNRIRLQALAQHPYTRVTRAHTDPKAIIKVTLNIQIEGGAVVTGIVRGLRPLLTDTV